MEGVGESVRSLYAMSAPSDSSSYLASQASSIPPVNVIQLMLVDELGHLDSISDYDSDGTWPAKDLIPGGSGSRKQVHLIVTRWVLSGSKDLEVESRIIHKFSSNVSGIQRLLVQTLR